MLLSAGADPNAKAHGHMTPLHTAAETGREEVVSLLLEVPLRSSYSRGAIVVCLG